jgi:hypothetical protein
MPRPFAALLALAALASAPSAALHAQADHTARRDTTLDARGARRVQVEGRAGSLRVAGVAGLREVRVRGTARASEARWLDEIRLEARRDGDVVRVRADIPDQVHVGWWDGRSSYRALDLVVEVPAGIDADVSDGSGDLEVQGVGALTLEDGSGEVRIRDVRSADVRDGSGDVHVDGVRGDVRLEDGSGSLLVARVGGAVRVERDGSGEVDVRDVTGDLVVDRSRGEGIRYENVRGRVEIPEPREARRARTRAERAARRDGWY